jgi:hypothetical protein
MAEASLLKSTIPSVAEQLANPAGLSTEVAYLRDLISQHQSLHFEIWLLSKAAEEYFEEQEQMEQRRKAMH